MSASALVSHYKGVCALLLGEGNPQCDAGHSSCDDVNPEVLHDIARNLSDLVEHATVRGAHECQCCCPSVGSVDVDAASVAVIADDEAREEQATNDGAEIRKPDAVENGADHVDVETCGRGEKIPFTQSQKSISIFSKWHTKYT